MIIPSFVSVSVIVMTLNEEKNIKRCLRSLALFDDVTIVDSKSEDATIKIAKDVRPDCTVVNFSWNGEYPKKKQWSLDNVKTRHDMVLLLDADECMTESLAFELMKSDLSGYAGCFVRGRYVLDGRIMRYGLQNNKLSIINKQKMCFPALDDLDDNNLGEVEGHYQPVLKDGAVGEIGFARAPIIHYALDDKERWAANHERYASWERKVAGMSSKLPRDPIFHRRVIKTLFVKLGRFKPLGAFLHTYCLKLGFLDGKRGLEWAKLRFRYYKMVQST
jgi:glycosyltransferase involved in cell wall biosynthesis